MGHEEHFNNQGMVRAGAPVPRSIGPGGRAVDLTPTNIAKSTDVVEKSLNQQLSLIRFFGYDIMENTDIKRAVDEVAGWIKSNKGRYNLATLMRAIRDKMKDIKIFSDNSFANDLEKEIINIATQNGTQINCQIYPIALLKDQGYNGNIDIMVDIDFSPDDKYSDPTFISIELITSNNERRIIFTDHQNYVDKKVDCTLQILNDSLDQEQITREIAQQLYDKARKKYEKVFSSRQGTIDWVNKKSQRVVRFDNK